MMIEVRLVRFGVRPIFLRLEVVRGVGEAVVDSVALVLDTEVDEADVGEGVVTIVVG